MTNDLVEMAANDQRIAFVLLHEIAHVQYRHGLRGTAQNAELATLLVLVAGDVSSANSFVLVLPAFLVETGYSRNMETEADLYAIRAMRKHRLDPTELPAILQRLEQGEGAREDGKKARLGYWAICPRTPWVRPALLRYALRSVIRLGVIPIEVSMCMTFVALALIARASLRSRFRSLDQPSSS